MKKILKIMFSLMLVVSLVACGNKDNDKPKLVWPDSDLAKLLPKPDFEYGEVSLETDDYISIDIYNVSLEQFSNYVDMCKKSGFTVDKFGDSTYYSAINKDKYKLIINYIEDNEEFNISLEHLEEPKDTVTPSDKKDTPKKDENKNDSPSKGISKKFKDTMNTYEEFFDEYIEFMKKYEDSSDPSSMLKDYTNYMKKYTETMKKFEELEDDLSDEELAYYLEVQTRISQKLLEVSGS